MMQSLQEKKDIRCFLLQGIHVPGWTALCVRPSGVAALLVTSPLVLSVGNSRCSFGTASNPRKDSHSLALSKRSSQKWLLWGFPLLFQTRSESEWCTVTSLPKMAGPCLQELTTNPPVSCLATVQRICWSVTYFPPRY
ncbi:UNVERIFIED_CONTAM: hypothetical protein K2H54_058964 [Gekko kuhli]